VPSSGIGRFKLFRTAFATLWEADPSLVRNRRLEFRAVALQMGTMLLDTATIWILLFSIDTFISFDRVFASFMVASLIRTAGFIPGGLGTFEATLVLLLAANGASVPSALSATLVFRGFSFWLPMVPGFLLSRRALRRVTT
jgi:Mg2+-importing ATPase